MAVHIPSNYEYKAYRGGGGEALVDASYFSTKDRAQTIGALAPNSQEVWGCAKINGRFFAGFHSGNWRRDDNNTNGHSEQHIVYHFLKYFDRMVKEGFVHADQPNSMSLKVTKSPCKGQCSPLLIEFVTDVNERLDKLGKGGTFNLRIKAAYVHEGDTQEAGLSAIKDLDDAMVPVLQWKLGDVFENKDRGVVTKLDQPHELSFAKETFGNQLPSGDKASIEARQRKFPQARWATPQNYKALSHRALVEKRRTEAGETQEERHRRLGEGLNMLNGQRSTLLNELRSQNLETMQNLQVAMDHTDEMRQGLTTMLDGLIASNTDEKMEVEMKETFDASAINARRANQPIDPKQAILKRPDRLPKRSPRNFDPKRSLNDPVYKSATNKFGKRIGSNNTERQKIVLNLKKNIENGLISGTEITRAQK